MSALIVAVALVGSGLEPRSSQSVRAQTTSVPLACTAPAPSTPMPGHYTGPWHSTADYHFLAFGHDIDLQVTIDGTLDVSMSPSGQMVGNVQGTVDAPEMHDGQKDVSSGHGTITGRIQGAFSSAGSLAVLSQPVIFMHWGTFVGGGYTADRYITMPDYQFPVGTTDCVGSSGTITEKGFPTQNIVNDFNGGLVQVPGVGDATGTWHLTSDSAPKFEQLSQQVNDLLGRASTLLDTSAIATPSVVDREIVQPLRALEATIRQDPSVSRCLLDRISTWEVTVLKPLLQRAQQAVGTDLIALRHAGDLLRSAQLLNLDCAIDQQAASDAITASGTFLLDKAIASGSWSDAALAVRELYLQGGTDRRAQVRARVFADLHTRVVTATGPQLLELARIAYLFGDNEDATAAYHRLLTTGASTRSLQNFARPKPKKKKHHPKGKPVAKPTPTPTATPVPRTLAQVLNAGLHSLVTKRSGGTPRSFDWEPQADAVRYLVTVTATQSGQLLWSWSGAENSVHYGDTTLNGLPGSEQDEWAGDLSADYTWSVVALDQHGQIIGAAFRVTG